MMILLVVWMSWLGLATAASVFASTKPNDESACTCASPLSNDYYKEQLWQGLVYFASTIEVLLRGFSLGFGARMLLYIFEKQPVSGEETDIFQVYKNRALVSAISGISMAAFIHGSSLFVPTAVREGWFSHKLPE